MPKKSSKSESPVEEEAIYEVEKITDHKNVSEDKNRVVTEFRVRWKGYTHDDDTWEPRDSLLLGAESLLDAYIAKQEKKGNPVPEDGKRRKSMAVEKVKEDRPPVSTGSSKESTKRKKKESTSRQEEEDEEERPKKKKEKPAPIDLSPEPEPVPTKKSKKKIEDPAPEIKRAAKESPHKSKNGVEKAGKEAPAEPTSVKKSKKVIKEPSPVEEDIIVDLVAEGPKGSEMYRLEPSWDHLVRVESLEQDNNGASNFRWYVGWGDHLAPEWISNEVARRKFPQRLFDFYEQHLKFRPSAGDGEMEE